MSLAFPFSTINISHPAVGCKKILPLAAAANSSACGRGKVVLFLDFPALFLTIPRSRGILRHAEKALKIRSLRACRRFPALNESSVRDLPLVKQNFELNRFIIVHYGLRKPGNIAFLGFSFYRGLSLFMQSGTKVVLQEATAMRL